MVKEKKEKKIISIDDLILKDFKECITNADYLKDLRSEIISISPKFDIGLGGGIPFGSFCLVSGKPGQGKSSLSLHIAAQAQIYYPETCVWYFDIEGRIKYKDLIGNKKLNLNEDKFKLVQSKPGRILTGDEFIDLGEKLINAKQKCVFIFDSFSAISTKARQDADIKDRFRDDANLLLSSFCKRISQVIPINQNILIGICHLIADPGPSRSQWTEAGGNKIKYAADVKIMGTYFQPWDVSETIIGQITHWKIDKSALGPPFGEITSYIRYGHGFDEYQEIIEVAIDIGIVNKAGAWISYQENKLHGLEKFREFLIQNPEIYKILKEQIESLFKLK
jgi:recombination protein RecA